MRGLCQEDLSALMAIVYRAMTQTQPRNFYRLTSTKIPRLAGRSCQGKAVVSQSKKGGESMSMAWPMIKEAKTYGSFNGKTMLMDLHLFHRRTATNVFVCRSKRRTLSVLVRSAVIIIRPQKKMKTQTGAGLVSIAGWLRLWARRSE